MDNYRLNNNSIIVNSVETKLESKKIRKIIEIKDLIIIIFSIPVVDPNIAYNNVIAIDVKSGHVKWQIEKYFDPKEESKNRKYKTLGPFLEVYDSKNHLIFSKTHGWRVPVDPSNGKIIKNIDLNTGKRPW